MAFLWSVFPFNSARDFFLHSVFHSHSFSPISTSSLVGTNSYDLTQQYNTFTASLCVSTLCITLTLSDYPSNCCSHHHVSSYLRETKRCGASPPSWATADLAPHNLLPPGPQLCIAGISVFTAGCRFWLSLKVSEFACHRTWDIVRFWIKLKLFIVLYAETI